MPKSTVLSCIQPSGELHIGNYFGAVANWARLQDSYRCIYGIVDLHAMTKPYMPEILRQNTEQMVIDLIACGLDPAKSLIFIQSLVPEHTELCWIFNCVCSYGDLTRQPQFKAEYDQAGDKFVSSGFFTYPVLQAADILIYLAEYVPVGEDQRHHVELSSNIAQRFNSRFGQFFPEPKMLATETPRIHSLADPDKKMSKSLGPKHYIGMFEDENSVRAKIKAAVTDSGILHPGVAMSPGVTTLFEILKACGKDTEVNALLKEYESGNRQYSRLKDAVADALVDLTRKFSKKRVELMRDHDAVMQTVREMSVQAHEIARSTLREVRALVGLSKKL